MQPVPDRKDLQVQAVVDQAPGSPRQEHPHQHRQTAKDDEIGRAELRERLLNRKVDHGPDDGSFDAAQPANHRDEIILADHETLKMAMACTLSWLMIINAPAAPQPAADTT